MEGELAHIGAGLAAIGSGAAAPVLVTWLATSRALCVTHRLLPVRLLRCLSHRIRRSTGDLFVPRRIAADVRGLHANLNLAASVGRLGVPPM
jgi:hypothetical protein